MTWNKGHLPDFPFIFIFEVYPLFICLFQAAFLPNNIKSSFSLTLLSL